MLMATWSVVRPRGRRAGQEMIAGMRSPPSSSSPFRPVNGQVSEKRSPPLSLVKMTMVLSLRPPAATSYDSTGTTFWRIPLDGGTPEQLMTLPGGGRVSGGWSAAEGRLAYAVSEERSDVWVMEVRTGDR
jgi:hypothetical protein